jgi:hypothetical protein
MCRSGRVCRRPAYRRLRRKPTPGSGPHPPPARALHFSVLVHCKNRFTIFPSPAGMSLTKLSLAAGNNLTSRESLVSDIPAWDGKIDNLFLHCTVLTPVHHNLSFFRAAHIVYIIYQRFP